MTKVCTLLVVQRAIFARQLRHCEAQHDTATTGVVIEAALAAIVEHLRATQGSEAAFNTLARHADAAAAPLLEPSTLKHGEER